VCQRLETLGLVAREKGSGDGRGVWLRATEEGLSLVAGVSARRRDAIAEILGRVERVDVAAILSALEAFGDASGEIPEQAWELSWSLWTRSVEEVQSKRMMPMRTARTTA